MPYNAVGDLFPHLSQVLLSHANNSTTFDLKILLYIKLQLSFVLKLLNLQYHIEMSLSFA